MTARDTASPAASLLVGRTAHRRERPFERRFSYAVAMVALDIDQLDAADRQTWAFGIGRAAPMAFRARDHGERNASAPLRAWAEERFQNAGVDVRRGLVRLITFPRVLGFGFAPISIWLGYNEAGRLRGAIHEVHNTFGETHAYVQALDAGDRQTADKAFHVSPFFGVDGRYRFTLRTGTTAAEPLHRFELIVENVDDAGRSHVASLVARSKPLNGTNVVLALLAMPLSGVGVVVGIHWQALLLWLKGARYRDKPEQRSVRTTMARADAGDAAADVEVRKRA